MLINLKIINVRNFFILSIFTNNKYLQLIILIQIAVTTNIEHLIKQNM